MSTDDEIASLVMRAKRGESAAFSALHARFARAVHATALTRAPISEADDVVQDTFVAAFKNLDELDDARAFGGWLLMIARRTAIDHRRRAKVTVELQPDAASVEATPRAEAAEVLEAIRSLPDAYALTLTMRLVEGMKGPEIAAATGLTHDSVRVNLSRGMKLLRDKLGLTEAP